MAKVVVLEVLSKWFRVDVELVILFGIWAASGSVRGRSNRFRSLFFFVHAFQTGVVKATAKTRTKTRSSGVAYYSSFHMDLRLVSDAAYRLDTAEESCPKFV